MLETVILIITGLIAGVLGGFFGIGGGVIIIPALTLLLGFDQKTAQGTSIAFLLPPVGILAFMNYYKAGFVDVRAAAIMIVMFLAGSWIASKFAIDMDPVYLKKGFAIFLIVYAVKLLFEK